MLFFQGIGSIDIFNAWKNVGKVLGPASETAFSLLIDNCMKLFSDKMAEAKLITVNWNSVSSFDPNAF